MVRLSGFEDLENLVRQVLNLRGDVGEETPLVWSILKRGGRPCGVEFILVAPRAVRLSAIWECRSNRVLFYDHDLSRFQVTQISGLSAEHIPSSCERHATVASMWRGK